jgi:hypothetical protein
MFTPNDEADDPSTFAQNWCHVSVSQLLEPLRLTLVR